MKRFVLSRRKGTPIAYPQLVLYIMSLNNVWYLEDGDEVREIGIFGELHLRKMHLEVMRVDLPRQPMKKATPLPRTASANQDEAQSSAPASSAPPSFMNASLRNIIQEELGIFERNLLKKAVEAIEAKVKLMLPVMERHNMIVKTNLEALVQRVSNLEEAVNKLKSSAHVPSTSAPEPASSAHGDATDAQMDPVMAVVAAIEGEEAQNDPLPPSSESAIPPLSVDPLNPTISSNPPPIPQPQDQTIFSYHSSESSSHQPSPDLSSPAPESSPFLLSEESL